MFSLLAVNNVYGVNSIGQGADIKIVVAECADCHSVACHALNAQVVGVESGVDRGEF